MITVPKIEAVYAQLFGDSSIRGPEDWEAYMKKLVQLRLARVEEVTAIDPIKLIYPLSVENVKTIIKSKFGDAVLGQAITENEESLEQLKALKELITRWQKHSLTNEELITLMQMKDKFGENISRHKELLAQASQILSKRSEPLIQVKETISQPSATKTSFDYVRSSYKGK